MNKIDQYRRSLELELLPWIKSNDPAHQWFHFQNVYQTGKKIRDELSLKYPNEAILLVAYVHDLFANPEQRDDHHNLSADWLLGENLPKTVLLLIDATVRKWYTPIERSEVLKILSAACRQHRASYRGEFYHEFCELMNSADYEAPKGLFGLLERSYKYSLSKDPVPRNALIASLDHMKDKFSRTGYAKYPEMYLKVYGDRLEEVYKEIDRIPDGSDYGENFLNFMQYMLYR